MSVFDENIITEEYLISSGFQSHIAIPNCYYKKLQKLIPITFFFYPLLHKMYVKLPEEGKYEKYEDNLKFNYTNYDKEWGEHEYQNLINTIDFEAILNSYE